MVVVLSKGAMDYLSPALRSPIVIIPNPVLQPAEDLSQPENHPSKPFIAAMGRLIRSKGFDLLLNAFAQLKDKFPEWTLNIMGEGPLQAELESLRDGLGLNGRVHFLGKVKNPHTILKQADLFVMSSRYEGFPMSLCEAMACGIAVICTNCSSGPREIIRHGVDGLLVPNEDSSALAAAMENLMVDAKERERLRLRAPEVTERFSIDRVMATWEAALSQSITDKLLSVRSEGRRLRYG